MPFVAVPREKGEDLVSAPGCILCEEAMRSALETILFVQLPLSSPDALGRLPELTTALLEESPWREVLLFSGVSTSLDGGFSETLRFGLSPDKPGKAGVGVFLLE